jgi:hypothetical protein
VWDSSKSRRAVYKGAALLPDRGAEAPQSGTGIKNCLGTVVGTAEQLAEKVIPRARKAAGAKARCLKEGVCGTSELMP